MKGSRGDKSLEGQMSSLIMLPKLVFSPVLTAMTRHSSSASCAFHRKEKKRLRLSASI